MTDPLLDEARALVAERWMEGHTLTPILSALIARVEAAEKALAYMAEESNWIEPEDQAMLKRPGGGFQAGIILVSHNLLPWVYARTAIAQQENKG